MRFPFISIFRMLPRFQVHGRSPECQRANFKVMLDRVYPGMQTVCWIELAPECWDKMQSFDMGSPVMVLSNPLMWTAFWCGPPIL
jgi:hypothetical protein